MNRVLWNSIGRISDNLISDADEITVRNHFKRRNRNLRINCAGRKHNLRIKYIGMAACFCLVICLCVPLISTLHSNSGDGTDSDSGYGYTYIIHLPGCVIESDDGILTYVSYTEHSVSFTLHKKSAERVNVSFIASRQNGLNENGRSVVATTDRLSDDGNALTDVLKITVNGVSAEDMPLSPGDYSITVDFSALAESGFVVYENFSISGFGRFAMQKYEIYGGTNLPGLGTDGGKEYYKGNDNYLY